MHPNISEFSYGYALTSELTSRHRHLVGAPAFPTTVREATLGYDVKIPFFGFPLFLQFKLSDCMKKWSATGSAALGVPHYRMHLRPLKHSDQHDLLLALERSGELVYYAAPTFHEPHELNDAYLNQQVVSESVFIRPLAIGNLPDRDEHFVCFVPGSPIGYRFSHPEPVEIAHGAPLMTESLPELARTRESHQITHQFLLKMGERLLSIYREVTGGDIGIDLPTHESPKIQPSEYISFLVRTLFGCEILLIGQYQPHQDLPGRKGA